MKKFLYSVEGLLGTVLKYKKVLVVENSTNIGYVRRISKDKIQELIKDPSIKSVKFLN